ncbi:MAG: epoxide hydrolase family protein [Acidobacteriota bacterium]
MLKSLRFLSCTTALAIVLSSAAAAQSGTPRPFEINVSDETLERVLKQFADARFPDRPVADGWALGTDGAFLERFRDFIIEDYDWRAAEARLNSFDNFMVEIDGHQIHYLVAEGEGEQPTPVLMSHGWPGSVWEFMGVIDQLTKPSKYGGDADQALTLVIPSVPGYGWSELKDNRIISPKGVAELFNRLMTEVLGYERYGTQGGDIGSLITAFIAADYSERVLGSHFNIVSFDLKPEEERTEEEKIYWAEAQEFARQQFDYFDMQAQEPNTVAHALYDNPVGISAWILDKFYSWTDHQGDVTEAISMDEIATMIMIYVLTDTIDTSVWMYTGIVSDNGGIFHPTPGEKVEVPSAFALFPAELRIGLPPRSWVEDQYNIVRWTEMPRGGHFAAVEEPDIFVKDVLAFFSQLKK